MVSESRTENGTTLDSAFTYDPLGQLTGFTRSDGISEQYSYDAVGNMTQKVKGDVTTTMTYNAANQLTKSVTGGNTTTYAYDHNGNLTEKQTATGTTRYTYNALNLLQSYTGEDGYTERYTYNADRLLSSITTPDSTTTLTWDLLHGDGVVISETTGKKTTDYTYGLERISAQTGSKRTEYVYDGRGSVAAEVSYNNAWYTFGGRLAWKHVTSKSYTPFGEQIGEKTSGFGYNGEYYNAATGMIYLRARFYEPEMNRFSQKDLLRGIVTSGTSLNRYLYCQNDPINSIDPSGMSVRSLLQRAKASVKSAVKSFVAHPIKTTVSVAKKVVNAIKNPVRTVKKVASTAKKVVKELLKPDPKPSATRRTVSSARNRTDVSSAKDKRSIVPNNKTIAQKVNNYVKNPSSTDDTSHYVEKTSDLSSLQPSVEQVSNASQFCSASLKYAKKSLPTTGEPGSSQTLPNPDGTPKQKRWYGPDGNPVRDRDYNHPGKMPFPHDHEWKDGKRGHDHLPPSPEYEFSWNPVIGIGLVTASAIGAVAVIADNFTGIGMGDDFLLVPLSTYLTEGLTMLFG